MLEVNDQYEHGRTSDNTIKEDLGHAFEVEQQATTGIAFHPAPVDTDPRTDKDKDQEDIEEQIKTLKTTAALLESSTLK